MLVPLPPAVVAGELVRLQTAQHVVALTFDGGGNDAGAPGIIRVLKRERVRATFFLTGRFVRSYRRLARTIGRSFAVGNHTIDHVELPALSTAAVTHEIAGAAAMIKRARVATRIRCSAFRTALGMRAHSPAATGSVTSRSAGR